MPATPATTEAIAAAAEVLAAGGLVAFPTETVYGLGADATNGQAVARIYEAKGRPQFNPLIVHVPDLEAAGLHGELGRCARLLAGAFWPGPLTMVVKRREGSGISELVTAGLDSVALRVPVHPVAQALLRAAGLPLAAPSANRSGHVSATTAQHVVEDLGGAVAMVLDAGPAALGLESSIVDVTSDVPVLLRPGAVAAEAIEAVVGARLARHAAAGLLPTSPGQLESHYAPRTPLRLEAGFAAPGEALLAFGPVALPGDVPTFNLSPSGSLTEAAANLFSALRRLDAAGARCIAVMPVPQTGLGEAINDRLRRAAAPRSG